MVESKGIQPDSTHFQALKKWPQPSSASEIKGFLGGINIYRKFIIHFSQIAHHLHHLSNSHSMFIWTNEATNHFVHLKEALCSTPLLHLPDLSQPFEIESDAS